MYLVRPWRSRRTRAAVRIGSDNAYGIYLAQMIFITSLGALGWKTFVYKAPFYVWLPLTVAIAYFGGILLTALLARPPLAVPLTYAGLQRSARAWARHLDDAGIPPGARVAVRLPDVFGYAAALVGILAAGRVAVPLDPGAPAGDKARMLKVAQPWALVGDDLES